MPVKYGAKKSEKVKVTELENIGYTIIPDNQLKCCDCGKVLSVDGNNFYESYSPIHGGNSALKKTKTKDEKGKQIIEYIEKTYVPYCKTCLFKNFSIDDMESVMNILYLMDMAYVDEMFKKALAKPSKTEEGTFGNYVSNCAFNHKHLRFKDSDDYIDHESSNENNDNDVDYLGKRQKKEALKRWGDKWSDYELFQLEQFYHDMKAKNRIDTPQDEDYLKKLAKLSVKIDKAIDDDESGKVKQLGDLYSKYMTDSKFRAMDMTDADKQGGIRTFSQIYAEVESEDFIPPWEKYSKFLKVGQDLVDKTIMHIENFTLRFNSAERMGIPPSDTPKIEEGDSYDETLD